jgi:hypothetical protein
MSETAHIRDCLTRAIDVYEKRPTAALQDDGPARAVWTGGVATRLVPDQPAVFGTDMPEVFGGHAAAPSPGWFFRAGTAACMATTIAMQAALRGIELRRLEVVARSCTDARGLVCAGSPVPPGPQQIWLDVLLEADTDEAGLDALLAAADAHSAMSGGLRRPLEVTVRRQPPTEA